MSRSIGHIGAPLASRSACSLAPSRSVDEESPRLRRPAVLAASCSSRRDPRVDRCGLRHLLRALGRRLSGQRRHGSRERSTSSAQSAAADRRRRSAGLTAARRRGRSSRRSRCGAAFALGWRFGAVARGLPRPAGALLGSAEAHRHHRRADDCDRLRPARRRGRRRPSTSSISHWLFVCTILLALFIALAKRRHELVLLADGATSHRPILGEYSAYLLDQMIAVVTASTLIAYIFYTISPETEQKFGTSWLGLTIPFPLYGIFRYLYLVHRREGGGSPADLLLNDRPLLACVTFWVRRGGADHLPPVRALTMPDFNVRSDSVNVEQIMEQIRARIREKRGVDYTEAADPGAGRREAREVPGSTRCPIRSARAVPARATALHVRPSCRTTRSRTRRCSSRIADRCASCGSLLRPILKLFFNPNPLIQALNIQSRLNTIVRRARSEARGGASRLRSAALRGDAQPRRWRRRAWASRSRT